MNRIFLTVGILLAVPSIGLGADEPSGAVRELIANHCVDCHGPTVQKAKLRLDQLTGDLADPAAFRMWVKVHDRVKAGEMPPKAKLGPKETAPALTALAESLTAADQKRQQERGRTVIRRLNRVEFENTLRDLLDLPWLEVKDLLPDDGRDGGYTRSAAALDVSPIFLAKVGEAIDLALDSATAKYSIPPEIFREKLSANQQYDYKVLMGGGDAVMLTKDQKYDSSRFPMPAATKADGPYPKGKWNFGGKYAGLGEAERAGVFREPSTVGMTRTFGEAFQGRMGFAPIHSGRYRIGVSAWSYWWDKGEIKPAPRSGAVGVYLGGNLLGTFDAPSLKPAYTEIVVELAPTENGFIKAAGISFWDAHVYFSQGQIAGYAGPGVALDYIMVEGPLVDEWPPPSHRRLFGNLRVAPLNTLAKDQPKPRREIVRQKIISARNQPGRLVPGTVLSADPAGDARRLLGEFLPRAFRRPVTAGEVERYAKLADGRVADGFCFEDAMKAAYKAVLLSPHFLLLHESPGKLDGYALANRLAYFLWNSMPDDQLTALAKAGKLTEPAMLKAETDRMLASPKARRFVHDFLDQWLELRDFDATSPDRKLYPEYTPHLEDAIRREPAEFFGHVLGSNLPVSTLVHTGINLVNQRLAEHYGITGVEGVKFRRRDVDANKVPRGGFLTMAATMKVTANGTTTTPVKRGAWVNKRILGTPIPPPPPDIAAIEPDVTGATSIRQQLAKHRDNTACASCHAKLDPPGFALESYDVIGGFRTWYRATEGKQRPDFEAIYPGLLSPDGKFRGHASYRVGPPTDPSGVLTDGTKFSSLLEYRKMLVSDRPKQRQLARNLANQLVIYATGAPISFGDRAVIERILDKAGGDNPKLKELLHEVVQSSIFQTK
jgi:mono/diheme cytochrome c family protein